VCPKASEVFDPMNKSIAAPAHKKKSAAVKTKGANLTVTLLPPGTGVIPIPKGLINQQLIALKRVLQIPFKRSMTQHEIRNNLIHHFKHHQLCLWEHMDVSGEVLIRSSNQNPDGDLVDMDELYIREQAGEFLLVVLSL